MLRTVAATSLVALALSATVTFANELIKDTGFESPAAPVASATVFNVGDTIGPWVVVGPAQSGSGVYVIGKKYTEDGGSAHFAPEAGKQFVDLSGVGNTANVGVQQTIPTTVGAVYDLTFSIGNEDDALPLYTSPSAATVFINGMSAGTFTSDVNVSHTTGWQQFSTQFTATKPYTAITFINAGADNMSGLDDVSVSIGAPSAAPR